MKKILLVCAAGMSTSLLVNKMKEAAKNAGEEISIDALPVSEAGKVIEEMDMVLLGPQVRFQKAQIENLVNGRIPVEVIDMVLYGTMNGEAVLKMALEKINS